LWEERQDYLTVVLSGWLNKENKIRSLLRMNVKKTGLPSGGPKGMAEQRKKNVQNTSHSLFFISKNIFKTMY
jgi:hypothetical protein